MQKKLLQKLITIAALSLLLLVPLFLIQGKISERQGRQEEVKRNIAETAAGEQKLVGPLLAVAYRERVERHDKDEDTGKVTVRHEVVERRLLLPPGHLSIVGDAHVETRSRGLYQARLFHMGVRISGDVTVARHLGLPSDRQIFGARAFLVMGVSDLRGVDNDPEVITGGAPHHFSVGSAGALHGQGMNVDLGELDLDKGANYDFTFPLQLTGSEHLSIAPTGDETTVALKSDWPHPSFQGRFLPRTRTVSANGFEAQWQVSHLARNFDSIVEAEAGRGGGESLEVGFLDPVNVYLQSERAVKYGLLFVVLTFAAFFLLEILRRLPIHPLQYLLVGLALAVFFLLLIALSEHLSFAVAYLISAIACTALIGGYLSGALGSRLRGAAFGTGLAVLYGVLYGVLLSEDNALVMGAVLIFAALGTMMLATRRLNWYGVGESVPAP